MSIKSSVWSLLSWYGKSKIVNSIIHIYKHIIIYDRIKYTIVNCDISQICIEAGETYWCCWCNFLQVELSISLMITLYIYQLSLLIHVFFYFIFQIAHFYHGIWVRSSCLLGNGGTGWIIEFWRVSL